MTPAIYLAEPISTIIGLTSLLAPLFGSVSGLVGGALVGLAVGGALYALSSVLANRQSQGATSLAEKTKFNERANIPAVRILVGEVRHGGALCFEEVKAPYLYMMFMFSDDECAGPLRMWIGANEISLPTVSDGALLTPLDVYGQPDYPGNLLVSFGYGTDDQTVDPIIAAGFASIGSDFRQRGIYRAVLRCDWGANQDEYTALWGQVQRPNPLFLSQGIYVFDARDPTQDMDDPETWKWSSNPTAHLFHYARSAFGGRLDPAIYDWDLDKIRESSDWDDSAVACADGTFIQRYVVNGMYALTDSPQKTLQELMSANRSRLIERGGRVWIDSSRPKSPVATLTLDRMVGGFTFARARAKRDCYNQMQTRLVDKRQEYVVVDGPLYKVDAYVEADGEPLVGTLELPYTDDWRTAQRIAKAEVEESRRGRQLSAMYDIDVLADFSDEAIGGCVNFSNNWIDVLSGTYRVTELTLDLMAMTVEFKLEEYDPTLEVDWTTDDEQSFTFPEIDLS